MFDNESRSHVVFSFGIGTAILIVCCAMGLGVAAMCVAGVGCYCDCATDNTPRDTRWLPERRLRAEAPGDNAPAVRPNKPIGGLELGPLNTKALNEEKNAGFLRRVFGGRNNAHVSNCSSVANCRPAVSTVRYVTTNNCAPCQPASIATRPNYCPTCPNAMPTGRAPEQPAIAPTRDCPNGRCPLLVPDFGASPRGEVKTGGFACANCGRTTVGQDWATDWENDTPVTFCCRHCWDAMNATQRRATWENWTRRQQTASTSRTIGDYPIN